MISDSDCKILKCAMNMSNFEIEETQIWTAIGHFVCTQGVFEVLDVI